MRIPHRARIGFALVLASVISGCSAGTAPPADQAPPASSKPDTDTGYTQIVSGAEDSVGALPGSPDALYRYRFRQTDPGSERFTFRDRDLSFYFKPSPNALFVQVENLQNRPVWIEWDRSSFLPPQGIAGKVAHATTRYRDRFGVQSPTQINGLQRYSDYLLPLDYLSDPGGSDDQLHRPFFPEDNTAPQYTDKEFGVDLVFRIDDRFRTYPFRFRVASVTPR